MATATYLPLALSSAGRKQIVVSAVFWILAFLGVIIRLYARGMKKKGLALNDYAILVAFFFTTGLTAILWMGVFWAGSGRHTYEIEPKYRTRIFVLFAPAQPTWAAANTAVKVSILHLYVATFPGTTLRRVCYGTMIVSGAYFVSVLLETFLLCEPVEFNWNKTIPGSCSEHSLDAYIAAGVMNLLIDMLVVLIPMPVLWKLQLSWGKKIGLMSMFSLGAFICIITLLRVLSVARMDLNDFTYDSVDMATWSIIEPALGIINATLPIMRPVGARILKSKPLSWARSITRNFSSTHSGRLVSQSHGSRNRWMNPDGGAKPGHHAVDSTDQLYPLDTVNLVGHANTHSHMSLDEPERCLKSGH